MNGLTIIETETFNELIGKVDSLERIVSSMDNRLSGKLKPYLTSKEVTEILGFNEDWLSLNKQFIGYSKIGGALRFKRADVEEYIEKNYHKINRNAKY